MEKQCTFVVCLYFSFFLVGLSFVFSLDDDPADELKEGMVERCTIAHAETHTHTHTHTYVGGNGGAVYLSGGFCVYTVFIGIRTLCDSVFVGGAFADV